MSRKHPGPYRPKPGSAVTGVLQLIASACERGLTAADIAKTLDQVRQTKIELGIK